MNCDWRRVNWILTDSWIASGACMVVKIYNNSTMTAKPSIHWAKRKFMFSKNNSRKLCLHKRLTAWGRKTAFCFFESVFAKASPLHTTRDVVPWPLLNNSTMTASPSIHWAKRKFMFLKNNSCNLWLQFIIFVPQNFRQRDFHALGKIRVELHFLFRFRQSRLRE